MKNSKVVNVQGSGMFKELYVFEVELKITSSTDCGTTSPDQLDAVDHKLSPLSLSHILESACAKDNEINKVITTITKINFAFFIILFLSIYRWCMAHWSRDWSSESTMHRRCSSRPL